MIGMGTSTRESDAMRVFRREGEQLEVHLEELGEILLFLEDQGWRPEQPRVNYLFADDVSVSNEDARMMMRVGKQVLDIALQDPGSFYPVRFDMGKFYLVVEFCEGGTFEISAEENAR